MMKRPVLLYLGVFFGLVFARDCLSDDGQSKQDVSLLKSFRDEYSAAATQLKNQAANIECRVILDARWDPYPIEKTVSVKGLSHCEVREYRSNSPKGGIFGQVLVGTPNELFVLRKYDRAGPWAVIYHESRPSEEAIHGISQYQVDQFLYSPFAVAGTPIPDLLQSPDVQIAEVALRKDDENPDGDKLVEVSFSRKDSGGGLASGKVVFSPAQGWVLRAYDKCKFTNSKGGYVIAKGSYSYKEWEPGFLFPVKMSAQEWWPTDGEWHKVFNAEVTRVSRGNVDGSYFALSTYGIPYEFSGIGDRAGSRTLLVTLFSGLVIAAVGFLIAASYLRRRGNV